MTRIDQVVLEGVVSLVNDNSFVLDVNGGLFDCVLSIENNVRSAVQLDVGDIVRVVGKLRNGYVLLDHVEKVEG